MLSLKRHGPTPELYSLNSIVMAQLDPFWSKIAMTAVVVSMGLLGSLIAAAIATD